ncbi:hypothetical protein KAR28_01445 [Candidatus Parcubacteria bacterium]|nr:hypothetical protein [Candidatus Parcubacteria bacterium]
MSKAEDIQYKINIILNEEKRAYQANGRRGGGLGSFNIKINDGWRREGEIPKILNKSIDSEAIISSQSELLLKIYSASNGEKRKEFKKYLLNNLDKDSNYSDVAYLIMYILHRLGNTVIALKSANKVLKGDAVHGYSNLLAMLAKIVFYEYLLIKKEDYCLMKEILETDGEYNFGLLEKINLAEMKIIENELNNADKNKKLKNKLKDENFWMQSNIEGKDEHLFIGKRDGLSDKVHLIVDQETGETRIDREDLPPDQLIKEVQTVVTIIRNDGKTIKSTKGKLKFEKQNV